MKVTLIALVVWGVIIGINMLFFVMEKRGRKENPWKD
jgi:hypothetical protein